MNDFIKSQDDLNDCNAGRRKTDVVLSALEKCEKQAILLCKAAQAINNALHWLSCPEDLSDITGKPNVQKAMDNLNDVYKDIEQWKNLSR